MDLGPLIIWLPIRLALTLISTYVTDLILAVVELLGRDMSRLVVEVREALEPVELWDEG
jgi:hypothetical protein